MQVTRLEFNGVRAVLPKECEAQVRAQTRLDGTDPSRPMIRGES